jgi:hypothetical protein
VGDAVALGAALGMVDGGAEADAAGLGLALGAMLAAGEAFGVGTAGGASVASPAGTVRGTRRTYPIETVPSLGIVVSAVAVE